MADYLCDNPEYKNVSDEEFENALEAEKEKYEPYWIKAIIVKAYNY